MTRMPVRVSMVLIVIMKMAALVVMPVGPLVHHHAAWARSSHDLTVRVKLAVGRMVWSLGMMVIC